MSQTEIQFIKKIKADGSPCKKCAEVEQRLIDNDYMRFITKTIIADERNLDSEGMQLAKQFNVERAPFFIVNAPDQEPKIYTVYFKLVKEIIEPLSSIST